MLVPRANIAEIDMDMIVGRVPGDAAALHGFGDFADGAAAYMGDAEIDRPSHAYAGIPWRPARW